MDAIIVWHYLLTIQPTSATVMLKRPVHAALPQPLRKRLGSTTSDLLKHHVFCLQLTQMHTFWLMRNNACIPADSSWPFMQQTTLASI